MRQPLVAGNWKMNGSIASIETLLKGLLAGIDSVAVAEMAVCSPYIYLSQVAGLLKGSKIGWGAQNLSEQASGAFTGEISASMLLDFQCQYVIVGHSERRSLYGESDDLVAEKVLVAHQAGLKPIVCVGELLEEREQGQTEAVVQRQLQAVLEKAGKAFPQAVIAYEPVWAIGTGKTATPEQAQQVHAFIRDILNKMDTTVAEQTRILYGGSMKPSNAEELLNQADIDGGLIGGASLKADDFLAIAQAAK